MSASQFRREIVVIPAFDKRDADPKKNYGIHNAEIYFYLHGEKGVIQFCASTGWHLPHIQKELEYKPPLLRRAWGTDLGYHSPIPMYEGQKPMTDKCHILGGTCYYDGSTLNAEPVFNALVAQGSEAVWELLEAEYKTRFLGEQ